MKLRNRIPWLWLWLRSMPLQGGSGIFSGTGGFAGSAGFPTSPIVANNGNIVITGIQSPNFVSLVQGWQILKNGNAQFNNVTITGTFMGTDFILTNTGLFFYSSAPALGNLIMSIVPGTASVIDPKGNSAPAGITSGQVTSTQLQLLSSGGAGILNFLLNNPSFTNGLVKAVATPFAQTLIQGPATTTANFNDSVGIELNSANPAGSGNANLTMFYNDNGGGAHSYLFVDSAGVHATVTATVIGTLPGTGGSPTNPASGESWHSAALINGWTGGGFGLKYRLLPMGDGLVEIAGDLINATATGNSICFTLPAGYRPATAQNFPAAWNHPQASNSATPPWVFVNTTGDVQLTAIEAANVGIFFHIFVPLDFVT